MMVLTGDADGACDAGDTYPWGEVALSFANVTVNSAELHYDSDVAVHGYQLTISGVTLNGISGAAGFDSHSFNGSSGTIIGYDNMLGATLPIGSGLLAALSFEEIVGGGTISGSAAVVTVGDFHGSHTSGPADATVGACANYDGDFATV